MEYIFGIGVAAFVGLVASLVGFDKDRAFYPVVLIVIASYYILFAAMGASASALIAESMVMTVFVALAIWGFWRSPWMVVVGLVVHGVYDLAHPIGIKNPGVPVWWPGFCFAYDITAAASLAWVLRSRSAQGRLTLG
jgi:hypothetical protein